MDSYSLQSFPGKKRKAQQHKEVKQVLFHHMIKRHWCHWALRCYCRCPQRHLTSVSYQDSWDGGHSRKVPLNLSLAVQMALSQTQE